jgi:hypothetical protein
MVDALYRCSQHSQSLQSWFDGNRLHALSFHFVHFLLSAKSPSLSAGWPDIMFLQASSTDRTDFPFTLMHGFQGISADEWFSGAAMAHRECPSTLDVVKHAWPATLWHSLRSGWLGAGFGLRRSVQLAAFRHFHACRQNL